MLQYGYYGHRRTIVQSAERARAASVTSDDHGDNNNGDSDR